MSESETFSMQDAHLAGPSAIIAIVDTETTGLEAHDEPISIGILLIKITLPRGDLIRELDSYNARKGSGVVAQPGAAVVLAEHAAQDFDKDRIRTLLQSADFVVAHYAAFVRQMVASIVPESTTYNWRCSARQIWWKNDFDARDEKLDTLCAKFGIDRPSVRGPLDECHALSLVLFQRTGQTMRSLTFMGLLITKPPLAGAGSPPATTEPLVTLGSTAQADGVARREQSAVVPVRTTPTASPLSHLWAFLMSIFR